MVFQGSALFDSMTILENVMFPLRMFTNQEENEMKDFPFCTKACKLN